MMAEDAGCADIVRQFQARSDAKDINGCLALLSEDVVLDMQRGRFAGKDNVRQFLENVFFRLSTHTDSLAVRSEDAGAVSVDLYLSDDNTRRLSLSPVHIEARYTVQGGRIHELYTRPAADSMEAVHAIQGSGKP